MLQRLLVAMRLGTITLLLTGISPALVAGRALAGEAPFLMVCADSTVVAPGQEVDMTFKFTCLVDSAYVWFRVVADRNWLYARSMDLALVRAGDVFAMSGIATVPDTAATGLVQVSCEVLFGTPQEIKCSAPFRIARVFGRGQVDTTNGRLAVAWPLVLAGVSTGSFERRDPSGGAWMLVGHWNTSSPEGEVQYVDEQAGPGASYEYRAIAPFGQGRAVSEVAYATAPLQPHQDEGFAKLERVTYAGGQIQLHFRLGLAGNGLFSVYDIVGRRLLSKRLTTRSDGLAIQMESEISAGVYLAVYEDGQARDLVKFIVVRN